MTKKIGTLVKDVHNVLRNAQNPWKESPVLPMELAAEFAARLAAHTIDTVGPTITRPGSKPLGTIWVSELGKPCHRRLWYDRHRPDAAEIIEAKAHIKFLYGDYIEELVLLLAEVAGHTVTNRQAPVEYTVGSWKVRGKMDCVIDGVLVDVKSMSPYGMDDLMKGLPNDSFGYKAQLSGYNGLDKQSFPEQGFVAIDKQNGTLAYRATDWEPGLEKAEEIIRVLENSDTPPRAFVAKSANATGSNMKLGTECSYCPYKGVCWEDSNGGKGLRGFSYSNGPVWLTEVGELPRVGEIFLAPTVADLMKESK